MNLVSFFVIIIQLFCICKCVVLIKNDEIMLNHGRNSHEWMYWCNAEHHSLEKNYQLISAKIQWSSIVLAPINLIQKYHIPHVKTKLLFLIYLFSFVSTFSLIFFFSKFTQPIYFKSILFEICMQKTYAA